MMNFRLIKAALVDLLGEHANGRFRVAGYQKRGQAAGELKNKNRIVQVYYSRGLFPKSGGGMSGPVKHDMTIAIDFFVSMASQGDLKILDSPSASAAQRKNAMVNLRIAEDLVDDEMDEFYDDVYQIVMDGRHRWLGHDKPVASRWIPEITKDPPVRYGDLVTLTGTAPVTCSKDEQVQGVEPVPSQVMDFEVIANEDPVGKAGVILGQGDFVIERGTLDNYIERGTDDLLYTIRPDPEA
jgi:hypothetical protein